MLHRRLAPLLLSLAILTAGAGRAKAANTATMPFSTSVTIVNTNGVPQAATQIMDVSRPSYQPSNPGCPAGWCSIALSAKVAVADTGGVATFTVNSPTALPLWNDEVTATRQVPEYAGNPCWAVPEGTGVPVPLRTGLEDAVPASTVTVPAIDGPGFEPQVSAGEAALLSMINAQRVENNVSPVTLSTVLTSSAASYVAILPPARLDYTDPRTYCMNSGPGMRAIDAGFPTFDVHEDVLMGDPTPDAAFADMSAFDHAAVLTDPDMTEVGIASKGGSWVIDTSILALWDPGHERAGDTGVTDYTAPPAPVSAPTSTPADSASPTSSPQDPQGLSPKLRITHITRPGRKLVVFAKFRRRARGRFHVSAVCAAKPAKLVRGRLLHRHRGRVHGTLYLRPGRWKVRVRFIGREGWRSTIRRRLIVVGLPRRHTHPHHR